MSFTQEFVDFTGLSDPEIKTKLLELNIPLTAEEALKIQNDMLGRAPSLSELISFPSRVRNIPAIRAAGII